MELNLRPLPSNGIEIVRATVHLSAGNNTVEIVRAVDHCYFGKLFNCEQRSYDWVEIKSPLAAPPPLYDERGMKGVANGSDPDERQ